MKALAKLMEKVYRGEGGLTLIEVLIVLLILSILVAVVVFNVGGFIGQGTEEMAKMQGNLVQTAIVAAMAAESTATVGPPYHIGEKGNGASLTNPAVWELTVDSTNVTMSKYVQGAITGYWEWNDSGVITEGKYTSGGKTCTYNATDGWDCS